VTHDQAEAMVISDRVAVLRDGRVVQIGSPAELFERPRTRFVAEFVGKTNLIDAVADGPGWVRRGDLRLRVTADGQTPPEIPPGTRVAVSIRPHQIVLDPRGRAVTDSAGSVLPGTVMRASYLGEAIDYLVALEGSDMILRIAGPAPARVRPGEAVSVVVPAAACVLLPGGD